MCGLNKTEKIKTQRISLKSSLANESGTEIPELNSDKLA